PQEIGICTLVCWPGSLDRHERMFASEADDSVNAGDNRAARICPPGALAKLDKAPVSKTGDSRFESWVPRYPARTTGPPRDRPSIAGATSSCRTAARFASVQRRRP